MMDDDPILLDRHPNLWCSSLYLFAFSFIIILPWLRDVVVVVTFILGLLHTLANILCPFFILIIVVVVRLPYSRVSVSFGVLVVIAAVAIYHAVCRGPLNGGTTVQQYFPQKVGAERF